MVVSWYTGKGEIERSREENDGPSKEGRRGMLSSTTSSPPSYSSPSFLLDPVPTQPCRRSGISLDQLSHLSSSQPEKLSSSSFEGKHEKLGL